MRIILLLLIALVFGFTRSFASDPIVYTTYTSGWERGGASFFSIQDMVAKPDGGVLVVDNNAIREVDEDGTVTTIAGVPGNRGHSDGQGVEAKFVGIGAIARAEDGTVYVSEAFHSSEINDVTLRKMSPSGEVTTFLRVEDYLHSHGANQLSFFADIEIGPDGFLYAVDPNYSVIWKVSPEGDAEVHAGILSQNGSQDGPFGVGKLDSPQRLSIDSTGTIYVAGNNAIIRKVSSDGGIDTIQGDWRLPSSDGGFQIYNYDGFALDGDQSLLLADRYYKSVYRYDIGLGIAERIQIEDSVADCESGLELERDFLTPVGILPDGSGGVWVADGHVLKRITSQNEIETIAGTQYVEASLDGQGASTGFWGISDIERGAAGELLVVDWGSFSIRAIGVDGEVRTVVGKPGYSGCQDGRVESARLTSPGSVARASDGTIYFSDWNVIRKLSPDGVVSIHAGKWDAYGVQDGVGSEASFGSISDIALDSSDALYVSDGYSATLRKVYPDGTVVTVAGAFEEDEVLDGQDLEARFDSIGRLAFGPDGTLYIQDGKFIRKMSSSGFVETITEIRDPVAAVLPDGTELTYPDPISGIRFDPVTETILVSTSFFLRSVSLDGSEVEVWGGQSPNELGGRDGEGVGSEMYLGDASSLVVSESGDLFLALYGTRIARGERIGGSYPEIGTQPQSTMARRGGDAIFSVGALGEGATGFQWQYKPVGLEDWIDFEDGAGVEGSDSDTLFLSSIPEAFNDFEIRGIVSNESGYDISHEALLEVIVPALRFLEQPEERFATDGYLAIFEVKAESTPNAVTGFWEVSTDGGITWEALEEGERYRNVTAANLVVYPSIEMDGYLFRNTIDNGWSESVVSEQVKLTVWLSSEYDYNTTAGIHYGKEWEGLFLHSADLHSPIVAPDGTVFIASEKNTVLRVSPESPRVVASTDYTSDKVNRVDGLVELVAGEPGEEGFVDGVGAEARFGALHDIGLLGNGDLVVADYTNHLVRRVTQAGRVSTIAGQPGVYGYENGPIAESLLGYPSSIVVDNDGTIVVGDSGKGEPGLRRIDLGTGMIESLDCYVAPYREGDSDPVSASFISILDMCVDRSGNIYLNDYGSLKMRRPNGEIVIWAEERDPPGSAFLVSSYRDGPVWQSGFGSVGGLAVDGNDNLYIADGINDLVRKMDAYGKVTTVGGDFRQYRSRVGSGVSEDGYGNKAKFAHPSRVAVAPDGTIYMTEAYTNMLRVGLPQNTVVEQLPAATLNRRIESSFETTVQARSSEGALNYRWQVSVNDGETWVYVESGDSYEGVSGPTLRVKDLSLSQDGNLYRCVISGSDRGEVLTSPFAVFSRPPNSVESWRFEHFSIYDSEGLATDWEDSDFDGVPNLIEYAFGTDPLDASSFADVRIETDASELSAVWPIQSVEPGVKVLLQLSNELSFRNWQEIESGEGISDYLEAGVSVFVRLSVVHEDE